MSIKKFTNTRLVHTKHADLLNALRECLGFSKPLPDVYDLADIIAACVMCPRYPGFGGRCPKHRVHAAGVL
jgi:hypothetical protein